MAIKRPAKANKRACLSKTESVLTWELVGIMPLSGGALHHHVIPTGDLIPHAEDEGCWCQPVGDGVTPDLWVHNSADGREDYETGKRAAN